MRSASTEDAVPYFSVIIPTYRRPDLLIQAVESVVAQTFANYEVIVIDDDHDGSGQDTVAKVAAGSPGLAISYHLNDMGRGGSGARNAGLARARGTWVAFLDDDDTWMPNKLAAVHALIEGSHDPDLVLVYSTNIKYEFTTGREVSRSRPSARGRVLDRVLYENCVGGMSVVVARRDVLQGIGGLDEKFLALQDMELYVRMAQRGTFDFVDEPLVRIRSSDRERITINPIKKLQGSQLFATKYRMLLGANAKLRHRAASRTFVFAFAAKDYGSVLRSAPWTAAGLFVDPGNLVYVFKSLARQIRARRLAPNHAIPASSR